MKSVEELQRQHIERQHATIVGLKGENDALREALAESRGETREWQELAVELGAFAAVAKDKSRMTLDCSLKIDVGMLAQARERNTLIATLLREKIMRPMVAECDKAFGPESGPPKETPDR